MSSQYEALSEMLRRETSLIKTGTHVALQFMGVYYMGPSKANVAVSIPGRRGVSLHVWCPFIRHFCRHRGRPLIHAGSALITVEVSHLVTWSSEKSPDGIIVFAPSLIFRRISLCTPPPSSIALCYRLQKGIKAGTN